MHPMKHHSYDMLEEMVDEIWADRVLQMIADGHPSYVTASEELMMQTLECIWVVQPTA